MSDWAKVASKRLIQKSIRVLVMGGLKNSFEEIYHQTYSTTIIASKEECSSTEMYAQQVHVRVAIR